MTPGEGDVRVVAGPTAQSCKIEVKRNNKWYAMRGVVKAEWVADAGQPCMLRLTLVPSSVDVTVANNAVTLLQQEIAEEPKDGPA
jgi:hypothetical protein